MKPVIALFSCALAFAACQQPTVLGVHNGMTPAAVAKADGGKVPITQADIDFMSGMIGHHAQAVVMAGWAPSHGAGGSVKILCERIVVAQRDEIGLMQNWLRNRKLPVPEADPAGWRMTMNGQQMVMAMPGMLTPEQMKELDAARGAEFDRLFLKYMIQHHEGAITMVNSLFSSNGAAQDELVFKFASDVQVDQATEIARMKLMLDAIPAGGNK
ncbi:MAG TPA: DUF305 domain-containing protein [Gemmatimonadaceae bacterium]